MALQGTNERLRWGLAGTGFWARDTHGAGLAAHPAVDFRGVWGRRPDAAARLATEYGVKVFADFEELVDSVDAVSFALPPDVQAELATVAASAGRHVLLDKPIALSLAEADRLVAAVVSAGVQSLVFLTTRFVPAVDAWLEEAREAGDWDLLLGVALSAALRRADSPYRQSPWRHEHGGLWDVGPHALAVALPLLGPVDRVLAHAGRRDLTQLSLRHRSGATSALTLSITMAPEAEMMRTEVYGPAGRSVMPTVDIRPADAFQVAVDHLHAAVADGGGHPFDVHVGRDIVAVLEAAGGQLTADN